MSSAGSPRWTDAAAVVAAKITVSAVVLWTGFRAISDDDYSRIVIAQGFAASPQLDPSGTSWLPFPFYVHGIAHALFGMGLEVARGTALTLGVCSALLAWGAARVLGASRLSALLGAALAAAFPYSAWLGVATVPEALTAGLVVFGAATLTRSEQRLRIAGGLALYAACFSRYEAWPVALVFALLTASDARRTRGLWPAVPVALGAPVLWLLHGVFIHGNALFFVDRVTSYRAALGGAEASFLERLTWYPLALLRSEPELAVLSLMALFSARLARLGPELVAYRRLFLCLACLLLFLVVGSLRGGVPTHHAERALLAIWFGQALFSLDVFVRAWSAFVGRARLVLVIATVLELAGALALRQFVTQREPFSHRDAELDIGREARLLGVPRLLVATDDYGYFAVQASFGAPARSRALVTHDPRQALERDPFASGTLQPLLDGAWLIAPRRHETELRQLGQIAARNESFVLLEARR